MCDMSRINVHGECRYTIGDVYSMVEVQPCIRASWR
jgi:hypothetical protein